MRHASTERNAQRIVIMIHDSNWLEGPAEEAKEARRIMKIVMITKADLRVPLPVKVE
jgi:DNA polymerase I-like protein with 3'-5' exonuclease and polymerase domains